MSGRIPAHLERAVRRRAAGRCEYCRLPQRWQEATFHVDHVKPLAAGGTTTLDNLALACVTCSLRKAARISVRDPKSGALVKLFNPRAANWRDHFEVTATYRINGLTAIGRATARALGMNRVAIVAIRRELATLGETL